MLEGFYFQGDFRSGLSERFGCVDGDQSRVSAYFVVDIFCCVYCDLPQHFECRYLQSNSRTGSLEKGISIDSCNFDK